MVSRIETESLTILKRRLLNFLQNWTVSRARAQFLLMWLETPNNMSLRSEHWTQRTKNLNLNLEQSRLITNLSWKQKKEKLTICNKNWKSEILESQVMAMTTLHQAKQVSAKTAWTHQDIQQHRKVNKATAQTQAHLTQEHHKLNKVVQVTLTWLPPTVAKAAPWPEAVQTTAKPQLLK